MLPLNSLIPQICNLFIRYWRFFNTIPLFEWDPDAFNDFRVGFVVDARLASCKSVHVYIHQINPEWDIVMDDVHISTVTTEEPTITPTFAPTEDIPEVSDSPSSSPTSMPTVGTATDCPDVGAGSVAISAGPVMLSRSDTLCVLTKAIEGADGISNVAPVARSYDGRAWEPSAGGFATELLQDTVFGDYSHGTQVNLPELAAGEKYFLTSYSYDVNQEDAVARLLETATFGTTAEDLAAWNKGDVTTDSVSEWIHEQIDLPMTSHREFFRRRVNPRVSPLSFDPSLYYSCAPCILIAVPTSKFPNPRTIGRSDHPCNSLSRWRSFAFSIKDGDQWWHHPTFSTSFKDGDKYVTVKLNGHVRTVVAPGTIVFDNSNYLFEYNKEYEMCRLSEVHSKDKIYVKVDDNSCQWFENPVVAFYPDSIQPPLVLNLPNISQSVLEPIDAAISDGDELIYFDGIEDQPLCDQLNDVTELNDSPVFGKVSVCNKVVVEAYLIPNFDDLWTIHL